jgi:hypothetical protein
MEPQGPTIEQALAHHAERQTKALESIVNLLWFFVVLAILGVVAGVLVLR